MTVSMKSGLEDRNNVSDSYAAFMAENSLNEVRPGRPEQCDTTEPSKGCMMASQ